MFTLCIQLENPDPTSDYKYLDIFMRSQSVYVRFSSFAWGIVTSLSADELESLIGNFLAKESVRCLEGQQAKEWINTMSQDSGELFERFL